MPLYRTEMCREFHNSSLFVRNVKRFHTASSTFSYSGDVIVTHMKFQFICVSARSLTTAFNMTHFKFGVICVKFKRNPDKDHDFNFLS